MKNTPKTIQYTATLSTEVAENTSTLDLDVTGKAKVVN
jgi:hypothetical protein